MPIWLDRLATAYGLQVLGFTAFVLVQVEWWAPRGLRFFLRFPGTFAHELCHYLTALLTGARPQRIDLIVRKQADGSYELGSVDFCPRWYNGAVVALAPFLLLGAIVLLVYQASAWPWHAQLVAGFLEGSLWFGAWPSITDWHVAWRYPALLLLALAGGCLWAWQSFFA